jgi:hypothetical protein
MALPTQWLPVTPESSFSLSFVKNELLARGSFVIPWRGFECLKAIMQNRA